MTVVGYGRGEEKSDLEEEDRLTVIRIVGDPGELDHCLFQPLPLGNGFLLSLCPNRC